MFFFKKYIEKFEDGGLIGVDLTHVSPDSSSGDPINPTKGDRAFEKGGKVDKIDPMRGKSGIISDKNSLFKDKMGLIMGTEGNNYLVKVGDRTVLVGKKGIDIVKEYKEGGKVESGDITAYCMKTKTKNVKLQDIVIKKTSKGGYIAHGHDGNGNKMVSMLNKARAEKAIADGIAKKEF